MHLTRLFSTTHKPNHFSMPVVFTWCLIEQSIGGDSLNWSTSHDPMTFPLYSSDYCTLQTIRVHNIVVMMQWVSTSTLLKSASCSFKLLVYYFILAFYCHCFLSCYTLTCPRCGTDYVYLIPSFNSHFFMMVFDLDADLRFCFFMIFWSWFLIQCSHFLTWITCFSQMFPQDL